MTSTPSDRSLRSATLAHRIVTSFTRRGKRERMEGLFRTLWIRNPTNPDQGGKGSVVKAPLSGSVLLQNFALAATPFVALRTRRRGSRQTTKVTFLAHERGQRKALTALVKTRATSGVASAPFGVRLRRQLEGLVRSDGRLRAQSGSSAATGSSAALRDRRDEIHRQALRALPMSPTWRPINRK